MNELPDYTPVNKVNFQINFWTAYLLTWLVIVFPLISPSHWWYLVIRVSVPQFICYLDQFRIIQRNEFQRNLQILAIYIRKFTWTSIFILIIQNWKLPFVNLTWVLMRYPKYIVYEHGLRLFISFIISLILNTSAIHNSSESSAHSTWNFFFI